MKLLQTIMTASAPSMVKPTLRVFLKNSSAMPIAIQRMPLSPSFVRKTRMGVMTPEMP